MFTQRPLLGEPWQNSRRSFKFIQYFLAKSLGCSFTNLPEAEENRVNKRKALDEGKITFQGEIKGKSSRNV